MDLPSSHQVPSGPMTRTRARPLETEVTSLLSQLPFESHETWLLPQAETVCIVRYQGASHGEAKEQVQLKERSNHEDGGEKGQVRTCSDDPDRRPDDPAPDRTIRTPAWMIRTPAWTIRLQRDMRTASPRTKPDHLDGPGRPDNQHDTSGSSGRCPGPSRPRSPDHPDQHPDHPDGAWVHDLGRGPCTPSPP